jgi:hypothetical protein
MVPGYTIPGFAIEQMLEPRPRLQLATTSRGALMQRAVSTSLTSRTRLFVDLSWVSTAIAFSRFADYFPPIAHNGDMNHDQSVAADTSSARSASILLAN